jgi:hypothetical protein
MQKISISNKIFVVGIILLFIGTAIIPSNGQKIEKQSLLTSRSNILYVGGSGPGNYTRIRDAVDNASDGDTVFVYDDSSPYIEHIRITKAISLVGENRNTTEIDAPFQPTGACITIDAENVTVSNFTIKDRGGGIVTSTNNLIEGNVFRTFEFFSIGLECGDDNNIIHNFFFIDGNCILLNSDQNIVSNNFFGSSSETTKGVDIAGGSDNIIKNNDFGGLMGLDDIYLESSSSHNLIMENTFDSSSYSNCYLTSNCYLNTLYHNNFGHRTQAFDYGQNNSWNKEYPFGGNYWRDYPYEDDYSGANQDQPGADGIGDRPVNISGGYAVDHLPLMYPYGTTKLAIGYKILFKPSMTIQNIGNTTAFNVQWSIVLKGGFIFIGKNSSGVLSTPLPPGQEKSVSSGFILGLGRIEMTWTVWAENAPVVSAKINGILLLFFFRIIRG